MNCSRSVLSSTPSKIILSASCKVSCPRDYSRPTIRGVAAYLRAKLGVCSLGDFSCNDHQRIDSRLFSSKQLRFLTASAAVQKDDSISANEFETMVRRVGVSTDSRIAIAVSGGPDSMALALLFAEWKKKHNKATLFFVTVDHSLRKESAAEAEKVKEWINNLECFHEIIKLDWEDRPPKVAIQESARELRYDALASFCSKHKIDFLCTGHHLNDQAETFLIRLARGSGVAGLGCMRPSRTLSSNADTMLCRPFLLIEKRRLVDYCDKKGQEYVQDPSNLNTNYTRVRVRELVSLMSNSGDPRVSPERFSKIASIMVEATEAMNFQVSLGMKACVVENRNLQYLGVIALDISSLLNQEMHISLRILYAALRTVGGHIYPFRMESLLRLLRSLHTFSAPTTLAGCIIVPWKRKAQKLNKRAPSYNINETEDYDESRVENSDDDTEFNTIFICPEPAAPPAGYEFPQKISNIQCGRLQFRFDWRFVLEVSRGPRAEATEISIRRILKGDKQVAFGGHLLRSVRQGWPSLLVYSLPIIEMRESGKDILWIPHARGAFRDWKVSIKFDPILPFVP